jgi:carbon monoxide dehydrogenase subunit G
MGELRVSVPTSAPPDVVWPLVRDISERTRFLPQEAFQDVEGDADTVRFRVRVAKGWSDAESRVVRVVEQQEAEERAEGDGIRYTAIFRLEPGALSAVVDYELAGIPGLLERTVLRPLLLKYFRSGVEQLVAEAERRASA